MIVPDIRALYLRRVDRFRYDRLPGFVHGRHFVPSDFSSSADIWAKTLLEQKAREELQVVYLGAKQALGLKMRQIHKHFAEGAGAVETDAFSFTLEAAQSSESREEVELRRTLQVRRPADLDKFAHIFPAPFEEIVVPIAARPSFADLVSGFEEIQEKKGGLLSEDQDEDGGLVEYSAPGGLVFITVRLGRGEFVVRTRALSDCLRLLQGGEWLQFLP